MGPHVSIDNARLPNALVRWFSDLTHQGIFATDRDLRVIVWNRWMEVQSGRAASTVVGRLLFELYPDLVTRGLDQSFRDALDGRVSVISHGLHKQLLRMQPTNTDLGFDEMPQSGRIAPLSDGVEIIGTVTTIEDISDRLASEVELRKQIEIQEKARLTAERALRAKDEFLSTVSHEMRNPLNAVLGWTRILIDRSDVDADLLARALRIIDRNASTQVRIIDDLLDAARLAAGKIRLESQPVDLVAITLAAVDVVAPSAKAKQIEIRTILDPATPRVLGDPQRLQQVAWNLLSNAVKFSERGGRIEVKVAPSGQWVRLEVRDNGQGIDPAFLPFVFERFRQSDGSSARRHGGLGLGLALVRELVELHGGMVRAESAGPRQGAFFAIDLPGAMSPDVRESYVDTPEVAPAALISLKGVNVLILEDERDSREMLAETLTACGARIMTATSSQDALFLIGESRTPNRPQVILSDIGMPKDDGFDFIRELRKLPEDRGGRIPTIAVTGYASPRDRERALAAGFDNHVVKPIDPAAIVNAVARAVKGV